MKKLYISENEKKEILSQHRRFMLNEQATPPLAGTSPTPVTSTPVTAPKQYTLRDVQQKLKDLGYYTGIVDGKFGPLTMAAIEKAVAEPSVPKTPPVVGTPPVANTQVAPLVAGTSPTPPVAGTPLVANTPPTPPVAGTQNIVPAFATNYGETPPIAGTPTLAAEVGKKP